MPNVILFHGISGNPTQFWFPYIKRNLEAAGYSVTIPQLPNTDEAKLEDWLPAALENTFDSDTILIGHSAGCALILAILETLEIKIKRAILVSGFFEPVNPVKDILKPKYNWNKIKTNCQEFFFINSTNDPWNANDEQGRKMFDQLGGTLIINNEGHMGSEMYHQPYKEFPLVLDIAKLA